MTYASSDFELITGTKERSPKLIQQIEQLWRKHSVLDESEIPQRLKEITTICLCSEKVVGVATTRVVRHKLFDNNYLYDYRCFIDPFFRRPGLDTLIITRTKEFLESERVTHEFAPIGILIVVENEQLKKWTNAVWRGADMYFAGITSVGHHLRVGYFKRALLVSNGSQEIHKTNQS